MNATGRKGLWYFYTHLSDILYVRRMVGENAYCRFLKGNINELVNWLIGCRCFGPD